MSLSTAAAAHTTAAEAEAAAARPTSLDGDVEGMRTLLQSTKAVVFDCDGVLWRGTGLIPGAVETVRALAAAGVATYFVTNNSTRSRAMYVDKFADKGLTVAPEQILSASYAAAAYLKSIAYEGSVYVVGEKGIMAELELAGLTPVGGPDQGHMSMAELEAYPKDPAIRAVVVGADTAFSYSKAAIAMQYLYGPDNADNIFVATNPDTSFPTQGNFLPGAGMAVGAVSAAASRVPTIVGKPAPFLLTEVLARLEAASGAAVDPSEILMIGDRLDTDIAFGVRGGIRTMLVFTGVVDRDAYAAALADNHPEMPDYTVNSVAAMAVALGALDPASPSSTPS